MRVLIVDDEPDIVRIATVALADIAHWEVFSATSGEEGIRIAARERPDVILIDLMLPVRDGQRTLADLRGSTATRDIPVILMTGAGQSEQADACLALGALGVIGKPFDPLALPERILALLGERK